MKALIVDDNPLTAMVMAETLRSHNFDVVVTYRGVQGLEYLAENPHVQVIIVDIMMPEMDGFEFVSKLREEPAWKDTPVVVCTTLADVEAVRKSAALGCRFYVLKPVTEEQLMLKIRQALSSASLILEHKDETMERVGMDSQTYQQTVNTFASILDSKVKKLEGLIAADVESISMDLSDVVEGSQLLGAEQLSGLLDSVSESSDVNISEPTRDEWIMILREMRALRRALTPSNATTFSV